MTFVGKILVILITVLSLFFLALSTVVFSTATNWKDAASKLKTEVSTLQGKVNAATESLQAASKNFDAAKAAHEAETKTLALQISERQTTNDKLSSEIGEQRKAVAVAQENMRSSQLDAEARTKETEVLREQLRKVQDQANEYKLRQTELNEKIRVLERDYETAVKNNKDLLERTGLLQAALLKAGLSADPRTLKAVTVPPEELEGVVRRVNASNNQVEISVGSDDGLVVGHELNLFRRFPVPEYLGKIRIISVDPDQAVGSVVGGKTLQGKKILEGDVVATQIRPRG